MSKDSTLAAAARLLEYPNPQLAERARDAAEWLDVQAPEAAMHARCFAGEVNALSAGALEEAYTAAFDFATTGTVYAGEHLFGPSQARASFLARLRVMQREHGLDASLELPDHLAELLRLAAAMPPGDERDELLRDAVLPTARAALAPLGRARHPFAEAMAAVVAVVEQLCGAAPEAPLAPDSGDRDASGYAPGAQHDPTVAHLAGPDADLFSPSPEATP